MLLKKSVYAIAALATCGLLSAADSFAAHVIESATDQVKVQVYGQVNRALLHVNDGVDSHTRFVDNDHASTRFGIRGKVNIDDLAAGMLIEGQVVSNVSSSNDVNQGSGDVNRNFEARHMDAYLQSKDWGKLSLGRGSRATDGIAEGDLSYTKIIGYSDARKYAGGFFFSDGTELTNIRINNVAQNLNASRADRIRYDSPTIGGFTLALATSGGHDDDAAVRYSRKFGAHRLVAGLGYRNTGDKDTSGSASILLGNGLSFSVAGGQRDFEQDGRNDAKYYYGKVGYETGFTNLGLTSFAVDYGKHKDFGANDRELDVYGVMAVQSLKKWGTDLYAGYRRYDAELPAGQPDLDPMDVVMAGMRVVF